MRPKTYICRPRGCGPCIREYTEPPEECCFKGCRVPGFCPHPEWYELVQVEMTRKGNVTANRETLLDNIEIALSGYGGELDLIEAGEYYDKTEARAALGKALASLELLRAEVPR